ncbi:AraC family transcriptional regulator [Periweissella cryptocerci]|uniref:AraC family transcriptional regulator n=1 Tax=Periweissella cryptocerci TaxID=2506420 RepID=A0A4P6YUB7_9LACO|nr:AraC family transcriptional regulator [Periweissella cryptocerci]QBO36306.1 AraC family transcriptional regulator [Periweissella cryptocerci]
MWLTLAPEILKPFINQIVYSTAEANDAPYTVPAGKYHVLGFQLTGQLIRLEDVTKQPLTTLGITGLAISATTYQSVGATSSILVFFEPGALAALKMVDPRDITGASVDLQLITRQANSWFDLQERLIAQQLAPIKIVNQVIEWLYQRIQTYEPNMWLQQTIALINQNHGQLSLTDLSHEMLLSSKQLQRRFSANVGLTVKSYSELIQFDYLGHQTFTNLADAAIIGNYYDQAHFTKMTKRLTGQTPKQYFKLD